MIWNSVEEFILMGGHGVFVFSAYGLVIVCLTLEIMHLKRTIETNEKQFHQRRQKD